VLEKTNDFSGSGSSCSSDACDDANGEEEKTCEGLEEGGDEVLSSVKTLGGEEETSAISTSDKNF
jgi:hypothetical protein